jgi:hypothetical protein
LKGLPFGAASPHVAVLIGVAALASYLPACRATRADRISAHPIS